MRTYVLKPGGTSSMAQRCGEYLSGRALGLRAQQPLGADDRLVRFAELAL